MARDLAVLDEPAMYALGMNKVTVTAFRRILDAVQDTLPEVVAESGNTVITLASVQLLVDGAIARLALVESELVEELKPVDSALLHRIANLEAQIDAILIDYNKITRRVAELENGVN